MNETWTEDKYKDTVKALYKRAAIDPAFRSRCLTDPAGAVKEISGLDLPAGAKVKFVEKMDEKVMLLPKPASARPQMEDASSALAPTANCHTNQWWSC